MSVLDEKQEARFTMAVFSAPLVSEIVVVRDSVEECKQWVDFLMSEWIVRASRVPGGALKQALTFAKWHYRIAHKGKIIEEGSVCDLPTKSA
jgi:hypothetical protein